MGYAPLRLPATIQPQPTHYLAPAGRPSREFTLYPTAHLCSQCAEAVPAQGCADHTHPIVHPHRWPRSVRPVRPDSRRRWPQPTRSLAEVAPALRETLPNPLIT